MKSALPITLLTFAGLSLSLVSANAAVVFADDFETGTAGIIWQGTGTLSSTPDVSTYTVANTSGQANTSLWVRANIGFNGSRNGLVDEAENGGANFTDPVGSQAYAFRYTNSGVTTASGVIGTLAAGTIITVSFDMFVDGFNGGNAYDVSLVTFNGGARNDLDSAGPIQGTTSMLARLTGTATSSSYQTVSFSYTVGDNVWDADGDGGTATSLSANQAFNTAVLGHDIAIRFDGATDSASWDNVSVSIATAIPEPSTALAGLLLGLGLLRRRR